jgi:endonuclease G
LTAADLGSLKRPDNSSFLHDLRVPEDWTRITFEDYTASGYDRGNLCPSADRSSSAELNRETFLMTNMVPQTPTLNRRTWSSLEQYSRDLVKQGNQLFITAGCYGNAGRIKDKITIPTNCWKIVVIVSGDSGTSVIDKDTKVIAVDMPNNSTVSPNWTDYITTVQKIEQKTGYNFLTALPDDMQKALKALTYTLPATKN